MFRSVGTIAVLILSVGGAVALTGAIATANPISQAPVELAQAPPRPKRPSPDGWLRNLNLSQEQIQKIREIRGQYQERLDDQRQAVRQAQGELKQAMASNASAEQIRQRFEQLQTLKQKLADTRMESMLAVREVLTPEQRQKLNQAMQQFGRGGRDRGGEF